ncbi:MAG: DNA-protecting protein DprA [Aquiluna sp.]|nr:DNA-protecting protein DprA [Aquiluna sp.]
MQLTHDQERTITYSALSEPGDALAYLIFHFNGPEAIDHFRSGKAKRLWPEQIHQQAPEYASSLPLLFERFALRLPKVHAPTLIERAIRWNARPVFPDQHPKIWSQFSDLELHQPYLLWVAGSMEVFEQESNSIVGTRNPTSRGVARTRALVKQLGVGVVSGGATGIDFAAHRAALDYKLPTAAFMAGGIDRAYPTQNWPLFHEMVRGGGALVSECVPFTAPSRFRFLNRNRLIAASSQATFVVEAGYRSGSRNTANHARACGREVFAIPGGWSDKASQGCNSMIKEGLAKPWYLDKHRNVEASANQKRVEDALREGARDQASIASESGLGIEEVRRELFRLKLEGWDLHQIDRVST